MTSAQHTESPGKERKNERRHHGRNTRPTQLRTNPTEMVEAMKATTTAVVATAISSRVTCRTPCVGPHY